VKYVHALTRSSFLITFQNLTLSAVSGNNYISCQMFSSQEFSNELRVSTS